MVDRLYTPMQACSLLGVGRTRLYALMKSGDLRSVKLGKSRRIRRSALDTYIENLQEAE